MGLDLFQLVITDAFTSFVFLHLSVYHCVLLLKVKSSTSGLTHLLMH